MPHSIFLTSLTHLQSRDEELRPDLPPGSGRREPSGGLLGTGMKRLLTPLRERERCLLPGLESLRRGRPGRGRGGGNYFALSKIPRIRTQLSKYCHGPSTFWGTATLMMQAENLKTLQIQTRLNLFFLKVFSLPKLVMFPSSLKCIRSSPLPLESCPGFSSQL